MYQILDYSRLMVCLNVVNVFRFYLEFFKVFSPTPRFMADKFVNTDYTNSNSKHNRLKNKSHLLSCA